MTLGSSFENTLVYVMALGLCDLRTPYAKVARFRRLAFVSTGIAPTPRSVPDGIELALLDTYCILDHSVVNLSL